MVKQSEQTGLFDEETGSKSERFRQRVNTSAVAMYREIGCFLNIKACKPLIDPQMKSMNLKMSIIGPLYIG